MEKKEKSRKKPLKRERMFLFVLAASLGSSLTAFATAAPGNRGKTQLKVGVSQGSPDTVSFEVPLYLTMCVTKEANGIDTKVMVPTKEYYIRNRTPDIPLAVTGMGAAGVAGGDWSLVETTTPGAAGKELAFRIGRVSLPAIPAGDTTVREIDIKAGDSAFYNAENGTFRLIGGEDTTVGERTILEVTGEVADTYSPSDQARATAQFRVMYTVSRVNVTGNVIDKEYIGPSKEDATTPRP